MKNAAHSKRLFRVFGLLIPPPLNFAEFHTRGGRGPQRGRPGMRPPLGVGTLRAGRAAAPGRKEAPAGTRPGGSAGGAAGPGKAPARHTPGRKGGGPRARAAHPSRAARARKPRGKRARFARKAAFFRASRARAGKPRRARAGGAAAPEKPTARCARAAGAGRGKGPGRRKRCAPGGAARLGGATAGRHLRGKKLHTRKQKRTPRRAAGRPRRRTTPGGRRANRAPFFLYSKKGPSAAPFATKVCPGLV